MKILVTRTERCIGARMAPILAAYMMTEAYRPELADRDRFGEPSFGIGWPGSVTSIFERYRTYTDCDANRHVCRYRRAGE